MNEAVERAHRTGILTAASLMVAAPAAADAVLRARNMPSLAVGLHLVLVEGWPTLRPEQVPDLVDPSGRLRTDMARFGLEIALWGRVRRQLAAEIVAQFEAFRATGLGLDHVNAHKHFHIHPLIGGLILDIGRRYGMRSLRVPREPAATLAQVEPHTRAGFALATAPWAALLRARARRAGIATPDAVFGLAWSGAMTERRVGELLARLPPGLTEIYAHPALGGGFEGHAPGYSYADELAALTGPAAREAVRASGASTGGYADFLSASGWPALLP